MTVQPLGVLLSTHTLDVALLVATAVVLSIGARIAVLGYRQHESVRTIRRLLVTSCGLLIMTAGGFVFVFRVMVAETNHAHSISPARFDPYLLLLTLVGLLALAGSIVFIVLWLKANPSHPSMTVGPIVIVSILVLGAASSVGAEPQYFSTAYSRLLPDRGELRSLVPELASYPVDSWDDDEHADLEQNPAAVSRFGKRGFRGYGFFTNGPAERDSRGIVSSSDPDWEISTQIEMHDDERDAHDYWLTNQPLDAEWWATAVDHGRFALPKNDLVVPTDLIAKFVDRKTASGACLDVFSGTGRDNHFSLRKCSSIEVWAQLCKSTLAVYIALPNATDMTREDSASGVMQIANRIVDFVADRLHCKKTQ